MSSYIPENQNPILPLSSQSAQTLSAIQTQNPHPREMNSSPRLSDVTSIQLSAMQPPTTQLSSNETQTPNSPQITHVQSASPSARNIRILSNQPSIITINIGSDLNETSARESSRLPVRSFLAEMSTATRWNIRLQIISLLFSISFGGVALWYASQSLRKN